MTTCLGDETVTQHCRVLDTDAFDIVRKFYSDFNTVCLLCLSCCLLLV